MRRLTLWKSIAVLFALIAWAAPAAAAQTPTGTTGAAASSQAGGREYGEDDPLDTPTVPGSVAAIDADSGMASAPADAPDAVKQLIWSANKIVGLPYRLGGGHVTDFEDSAYDCSGTVSFALHGADLLKRPRDSSSFFRYGAKGLGDWITIYTRSSHAYMTVAGIRLDTSAANDPGGLKGPRWRPLRPSDAGYLSRHPVGL